MIDIERLEKKDIGRWVVYNKNRPTNAGEEGKIKSWTRTVVFVVYSCDNDWSNFQSYTGCATDPNDLDFKRKE